MTNAKPSNITRIRRLVSTGIEQGVAHSCDPTARNPAREFQVVPSRVALRLAALRFCIRHRSFPNRNCGVSRSSRALLLMIVLSLLLPATTAYARPVSSDQPKDTKVDDAPRPPSKAADSPDKSEKGSTTD